MNHGTGELEGPRLCLVQYCQFEKKDFKEPSNKGLGSGHMVRQRLEIENPRTNAFLEQRI